MDWTALLRLPSTILLVLAVVALLFTLVQLVALRQCLHGGQRLASAVRAALLLVAFSLTLMLAGAGFALRGYRLLAEETPVVEIDARILSPQRWALTLHWPDGATRQVQLAGDDWRVEAIVLKWKRLPCWPACRRFTGSIDCPAATTTRGRKQARRAP